MRRHGLVRPVGQVSQSSTNKATLGTFPVGFGLRTFYIADYLH
jgi:hypothetical protein